MEMHRGQRHEDPRDPAVFRRKWICLSQDEGQRKTDSGKAATRAEPTGPDLTYKKRG